MFLAGMFLLVSGVAVAETSTNRILVLVQQGQPPELAADIAEHIARSYRCVTGGMTLNEPLQRTRAAAFDGVQAQRKPADRIVIMVVDQPANSWTNAAVLNGIAIVNMAAYREGINASPASQEIYMGRLERETVRLVGLALGMKPCPFPLCALWQSKTVPELDAKARNLCPHCQGLSGPALKNAGLAVVGMELHPKRNLPASDSETKQVE